VIAGKPEGKRRGKIKVNIRIILKWMLWKGARRE
jgi:hypothetical protein